MSRLLLLPLLLTMALTPPTQYDRVVVLGDSLNDNGTFAPVTLTGKFTNGGGAIWTELLAARHGVPLRPAYLFDGSEFIHQPGGTNYAQSGTRVVAEEGMWEGYSRSVAWQVDRLLEHDVDLERAVVLMDGGGPDLVGMGIRVAQDALTPEAALQEVEALAAAFAEQAERVAAAGPGKLVLIGVGNFGNVPAFGAGEGPLSPLMSRLSVAFNEGVVREAKARGLDFVFIDTAALFDHVRQHPSWFGLVDVSVPSTPENMVPPTPTGHSANAHAGHLVSPDADRTYLFADLLHLSTRGHEILADHAIARLGSGAR